jgi:hypothetical protein
VVGALGENECSNLASLAKARERANIPSFAPCAKARGNERRADVPKETGWKLPDGVGLTFVTVNPNLGIVRLLLSCFGLLSVLVSANGEPASYLRVSGGADGNRRLELASRTLASPEYKKLKVTLLGVSHVGDHAFYKRIQERLDAADLVLFEGVGWGDGPPEAKPGKTSGVGELQDSLANSMGLVFQLRAIRYDRPHFRNSDMSLRAFTDSLSGKKSKPGNKADGEGVSGKPGKAPQQEKDDLAAQEVMRALSGDSIVFSFVSGALKIFGESPKFRGLMKLAMVETLGALGGDVSSLAKAAGPGMEKFMRTALEKRNAIVIKDLKEILKSKEGHGDVVVFYGAAHMPDLERQLADKFGFAPVGEKWLSAFGVNPKEAGLSALEVNLVRNMIKMQIRKLVDRKK